MIVHNRVSEKASKNPGYYEWICGLLTSSIESCLAGISKAINSAFQVEAEVPPIIFLDNAHVLCELVPVAAKDGDRSGIFSFFSCLLPSLIFRLRESY
jgi:hypothetical protein